MLCVVVLYMVYVSKFYAVPVHVALMSMRVYVRVCAFERKRVEPTVKFLVISQASVPSRACTRHRSDFL